MPTMPKESTDEHPKKCGGLNRQRDREIFEAIFALKATDAVPGFNIYDQFVALHGAVMGVLTPNSGSNAVNFGHGNIGFLPWHRQYLHAFEKALSDAINEEVNIPYWEWTDDIGAANRLFTPDFLSSLRRGNAQGVSDGLLRFSIPNAKRPVWWPSGLSGFRVDELLEENRGMALERGSTESFWPPMQPWLDALTNVNQQLIVVIFEVIG